MGQYHRIRCPICSASIETSVVVEYCPACKEPIEDALRKQGDGTGINTAVTSGEGFRPLGGTIQDVY